jgi:hypothetical protein
MAAMREVRQAGSDPAFLVKAVSEAAGELQRALFGVRRRELLLPGEGFDDCWCLLSVAVHMRDTERGLLEQLRALLSTRDGTLPHVDIDGVPIEADYASDDADDVLEEFHRLRRRTTYLLWDLSSRDWERSGLHPFRGRMTLLEIVREIYQHDLEHLWQVRRMIESRAGARR